jgi:large subunit ribosomal protein L15
LPHKLRKIRKRRGSRTQGAGRVGQHRKGSKGRRKAGRHKEGWTYVIKYEPDYFGKKGFTSKQTAGGRSSIINVGELEELADRQTPEKMIERKEGRILLDLDKLGYDKLLRTGKITTPILIQVASHSELAAKKIGDAGGQILNSPQPSDQQN